MEMFPKPLLRCIRDDVSPTLDDIRAIAAKVEREAFPELASRPHLPDGVRAAIQAAVTTMMRGRLQTA